MTNVIDTTLPPGATASLPSSPVNDLVSLDVAAALIRAGRPCCIAGEESLLRQLPTGTWIGGTIPYFMSSDGGVCDRRQVFVNELPAADPRQCRTVVYDTDTLPRICTDIPENGYGVVVLPAFAPIHAQFAQDAPNFDDMYLRPLVGWVAGVHLDNLSTDKPRVIDGRTGRAFENVAVALQVALPENQQAVADIINLFEPGEGPAIEFGAGGFQAVDCTIDGRPANLHDWMVSQRIDTRLPLVADYAGAHVNVSIRALDAAQRRVDFYAPVFAGVRYHVARPVGDYVASFEAQGLQGVPDEPPAFCCNCILNYVYGGLEGRRTGALRGPMTFGEIGYQLLNQTLVHLRIEDIG